MYHLYSATGPNKETGDTAAAAVTGTNSLYSKPFQADGTHM